MLQVGRTPLYIATQRGQTAIVEMLVEKFHANVSSRSNDGSTLMHVAALCGNADTAMAMLKKGVPLNMPNKVSCAVYQSFCLSCFLLVVCPTCFFLLVCYFCLSSCTSCMTWSSTQYAAIKKYPITKTSMSSKQRNSFMRNFQQLLSRKFPTDGPSFVQYNERLREFCDFSFLRHYF